MEGKIFLILLVLMSVARTSTGLKCYACSSSPSIYNSDCDKGTPNVRFGTCPTALNKKYYCIATRTNYPDGSSTVLRDCSTDKNGCTSDLCNPATTARPHILIWTFGFLIVSFFSNIGGNFL